MPKAPQLPAVTHRGVDKGDDGVTAVIAWLHQPGDEAGGVRTWLDVAGLDAQHGQLAAVGLGQAFDVKLRRDARTEEVQAHPADDTGDKHQQAGALRTHQREHSAGDALHVEHVDVEALLPVVRRESLKRPD